MEESNERNTIDNISMDYAVDFIIPLPYQLPASPLDAPRQWCGSSIKGAWAVSRIPEPIYYDDELADLADPSATPSTLRLFTGVYKHTFRFEREADAALFKLFWSGRAQ